MDCLIIYLVTCYLVTALHCITDNKNEVILGHMLNRTC